MDHTENTMGVQTPICDFIDEYLRQNALRLHMPGHKGKSDACSPLCGAEKRDVTEICGADVLYDSHGIIRSSEDNAAALFGAARTVYSTEGSSLSIRAMVYLTYVYAKAQKKRPLIAAGRNAHKSFLTALGLVGMDVLWLYGEGNDGGRIETNENSPSLLSCRITPNSLHRALENCAEKPVAVYITSPDYLGNVADIAALSAVTKKHGVLLLVDNAHGAYLRFLPESAHPVTLGADAVCDSAHKTLPVLTGGGYLHLSKSAPQVFFERVETAMSLFASTSPSYLILQSLDYANKLLSKGYVEELQKFVALLDECKAKLKAAGFILVGNERMKLTVQTKPHGYLGTEVADYLRKFSIECEFSDPDFLTVMPTPQTGKEGLQVLVNALISLPKKPFISTLPPTSPHGEQVISIREALLSPSEEVGVGEAIGRILTAPTISCPPAIPIVTCGERIDEQAAKCLAYYGVKTCLVIKK